MAWGKGGPRGRTGRLLTGTGAAVSTTSGPWSGGVGVQMDAEAVLSLETSSQAAEGQAGCLGV